MTCTPCFSRVELRSYLLGELPETAAVCHPAIVQATDGGEAEGVHFLVMELIELLATADDPRRVLEALLSRWHYYAEMNDDVDVSARKWEPNEQGIAQFRQRRRIDACQHSFNRKPEACAASRAIARLRLAVKRSAVRNLPVPRK